MFLTIVNDLTYEEVVFLSRNTTIKNTLPVNTENYVREWTAEASCWASHEGRAQSQGDFHQSENAFTRRTDAPRDTAARMGLGVQGSAVRCQRRGERFILPF